MLGHHYNRLQDYPLRTGKWSPHTGRSFIFDRRVKRFFDRLCALPARPDAQSIFAAANLFDEWIVDWRKSKGEYGRHHDYAKFDLGEFLVEDVSSDDCPGIAWIVDLWERLGGAGRYTSHPMQRPREPRYHVEPTPEAIADLADRLNLAPKNEVEHAILGAQFERMSLSLRVRLAPMLAY